MNHIFFNIKKKNSISSLWFSFLEVVCLGTTWKILLNAWHGENVITKISCFAEGDCSIDIILRWAQFLGFTVGPQINISAIFFCIITYKNDINNICFSKYYFLSIYMASSIEKNLKWGNTLLAKYLGTHEGLHSYSQDCS